MSIEDIDFDDDTIQDTSVEKYKGRQGFTDRIGIVMSKEDGLAMKKGKSHYMFGSYVICKGGLCCELAPKPADHRIGAIIIQYRTNKKGEIEKPFAYELKPWVFSEKKFLALKRQNEEWPLTEHDIKVTCKEAQYQQLEFSACKESLWQKNPKLKKEVIEQAKRMIDKIWFGKDLSNDELKELAGMESEGVEAEGGDDNVSDEDYQDILGSL